MPKISPKNTTVGPAHGVPAVWRPGYLEEENNRTAGTPNHRSAVTTAPTGSVLFATRATKKVKVSRFELTETRPHKGLKRVRIGFICFLSLPAEAKQRKSAVTPPNCPTTGATDTVGVYPPRIQCKYFQDRRLSEYVCF